MTMAIFGFVGKHWSQNTPMNLFSPHPRPYSPWSALHIYWQGLGWGKNRVISVLRLQCLPTNPNIAIVITCNPHNLCLQYKILHHLHNRQIQGSGGCIFLKPRVIIEKKTFPKSNKGMRAKEQQRSLRLFPLAVCESPTR